MMRKNWLSFATLAGGLSAAAWAISGFTAATVTTGCGSDDETGGSGGCNSDFQECGGSGGTGATGTGGGGAGPTVDFKCEGECCPTEAQCYGSVPDGYGDECFAQRDQGEGTANENRLQYKLSWARSTKPPGNTNPTVYQVLSSGANLPWDAACNQSGLGIFIQLLDLDLTDADEANHRVRSGWAGNQQTADAFAVASSGLCMVEDTYDAPDYNLPADQMSPTDGWPTGLPDPMARGPRGQAAQNPWQVKPAVLARIPTPEGDFDIASERQDLINRANDLGVDGLTFINRDTGYSHSYVKQTWVVVTLGVPIAIPIREVETVYQINDPKERACMGAYRSHALTSASDCLSATDQLNPEWGHYQDADGPAGQAPAFTAGYFLISELEQVYSQTLSNTLCVTYPGEDPPGSGVQKVEGEGFLDATIGSCVTGSWDPANGGTPKGDWCSKTNGPATADCYDAWRSETYQTFQAFPVQDATCPGLAAPAP